MLDLAAPIFAVSVLGALPDFRVPARQQQRIGVADFRNDDSQIAGRIKETWIPALPIGQQGFDLVAKGHDRNVTERSR